MNFPYTPWRLIRTPPASGAWNMAIDEAILETTARREALPTLRLYSWAPACLSLGYSQPANDVDRAALAAHGWEWVRRPTGGRAILHVDELTYSVCGPQDEPRLVGSVLESYRVLSAALLEALQRLGIAAQVAPKKIPPGPAAAHAQNPVCFEVPSDYEITCNGKKLIGSAQARRKEGVLQHGSLPLFGDLARIAQVLAFPDEPQRASASRRLMEHATTVEQILGVALELPQAEQAFIAAFEVRLNLQLQPMDLTHAELQRAAQLVEEKYAHPGWNERV